MLFENGWGMRSGTGCRLGLFHKISREDAKALLELRDQPPQSIPLPTPEPQEVGSEPGEEEPPDSNFADPQLTSINYDDRTTPF